MAVLKVFSEKNCVSLICLIFSIMQKNKIAFTSNWRRGVCKSSRARNTTFLSRLSASFFAPFPFLHGE